MLSKTVRSGATPSNLSGSLALWTSTVIRCIVDLGAVSYAKSFHLQWSTLEYRLSGGDAWCPSEDIAATGPFRSHHRLRVGKLWRFQACDLWADVAVRVAPLNEVHERVAPIQAI